MKVRILTYHFSDNIGALLQAYALRKWFQRQGHDTEFIPYHPRYVEEGGSFHRLLDPRHWRRNAVVLFQRAARLRARMFGDRTHALQLEAFRRNVLGVTDPPIRSAADLEAADPGDLLVCGSDQIWNPSPQHGLDPAYFLSFAGAERAHRVSYAASFGRSTLAEEYGAEAANLLSHLDGISVRERSGVHIVASLTGRQAVAVPDPTLLLGEFSDLMPSTPRPEGYVFCYALRSPGVIRTVATIAAGGLGTAIVSPSNPHRRWRPIGREVHLTPIEWVRALAAARLVVTNSFHGVAMSIVLRRPFIATVLPGKRAGLTERVVDLLGQVGLTERLLMQAHPAAVREVVASPIDWPAVEAAIAVLRRRGEAFLQREIPVAKSRAEDGRARFAAAAL